MSPTKHHRLDIVLQFNVSVSLPDNKEPLSACCESLLGDDYENLELLVTPKELNKA